MRPATKDKIQGYACVAFIILGFIAVLATRYGYMRADSLAICLAVLNAYAGFNTMVLYLRLPREDDGRSD